MSDTVQFKATIDTPKMEQPDELPPAPPPSPMMSEPSDLAEILPIVLLGVGIAYVAGVISGSFIFSKLE
jgi:hypothetical protein